MKKVLHIVAKMNLGGTESFLMNIYRNIDKTKVQFYFLTFYEKDEKGFFDEEILHYGGKIINIPSIKKVGILQTIKNIRQVLRKNDIDIIHCHTTHSCGLSLFAAKLENIKIRIIHSHNVGNGEKFNIIRFLYKLSMKVLINSVSNKFAACSKKSAEYLFFKKNIKNFHFIPNGIDFNKFINSNANEKELKKELNIPIDAKIIGHIGRYGKVKNHEFIIKMFKQLISNNSNIYLILIGDGPTRPTISKEIHNLNINNNVRVLGLRTDVEKLLNIMDVFILPSLFEGFGIVLLEAQSIGIPCVVSENIQKEVDIGLNLIKWVKLDNIDKWIQTILNNLDSKIDNKQTILNAIEKSPYKLNNIIKKFYQLYEIQG